MAADSEATSEVFQRYTAEHGTAGPIGGLAAHLAARTLDRAAADEIIGSRPSTWLKPAVLELLLYFLRDVLRDHRLTEDEQLAIRELKLLLRITEGDFARYRRAEVQALLSEQLERMLCDDFIDDAEALQQVELQRAFDLSFDEYLALTRPAIEAAVERLLHAVEGPRPEDEKRVSYAKLDAIATAYLLSTAQRRRFRNR